LPLDLALVSTGFSGMFCTITFLLFCKPVLTVESHGDKDANQSSDKYAADYPPDDFPGSGFGFSFCLYLSLL